MSITSKIVKKQKVATRPGYDITVLYTDSESGYVYTKTFYFASSTEPTNEELSTRITHIQSNVQDTIDNPPVVDKTEAEIIDILIEKDLLETGQTIDDLQTKTQIIEGAK